MESVPKVYSVRGICKGLCATMPFAHKASPRVMGTIKEVVSDT
jgi:hypothetical protein